MVGRRDPCPEQRRDPVSKKRKTRKKMRKREKHEKQTLPAAMIASVSSCGRLTVAVLIQIVDFVLEMVDSMLKIVDLVC